MPRLRRLLGFGLVLGIVLLVASSGTVSLVATPEPAGILGASWTAPTTNDDGTPLTDLAGYRVYYGISDPPCPGPSFVQVASATPSPAPDQTVSVRLTSLAPGGLYYVSVTAVDTSGHESLCSPPASAVAQVGVVVSPTGTVNFGSVHLGRVADQIFTVHNTSGGTVSGTAVTSAPFSVVSGSPFGLVGEGATQAVTVRFSPTVSATATTNVTFTASNGASTSRTVTGTGIGVTTTPLAATITSPIEGVTGSGTMTVAMAASGASGLPMTFTLTVDGVQVFTTSGTASTASFDWDSRAVTNGLRTLGLTVRDGTGRIATATRAITVSNPSSPPPADSLRVIFTRPAEGATVSSTVWVDIWVEGAAGLSNTFTLSVAGSVVATKTTPGAHVTLPWNSRSFPNGPHTLSATVRDATANTGMKARTVTVRN